MSRNRFRDHVIILPEDDADRQIANDFCSSHHLINANMNVQVVNEAGGWRRAQDLLEQTYVPYLQKFMRSRVVLVIDFDSRPARRIDVLRNIPKELQARVFVIRSLTNPEELKSSLNKTLEEIGIDIADQCARETTDSLWNTDLLSHNRDEINRLSDEIRGLLFPVG
jgi:hypothetical protein